MHRTPNMVDKTTTVAAVFGNRSGFETALTNEDRGLRATLWAVLIIFTVLEMGSDMFWTDCLSLGDFIKKGSQLVGGCVTYSFILSVLPIESNNNNNNHLLAVSF